MRGRWSRWCRPIGAVVLTITTLLVGGAVAASASPQVARTTEATMSPSHLATASAFGSSSATAPKVVSFSATPSILGSAGGSVRLLADVSRGRQCAFSSSTHIAGMPFSAPCSARVLRHVTIPRNVTKMNKFFTFVVHATGMTGAKVVAFVSIRETGHVPGVSRVSTATAIAPQITLQPTDQSVSDGATATFTATANSAPTASVQWMVSVDAGSSWSDIAGATSTTYSFVAHVSDSGKEFESRFSNATGEVHSNPATLTVIAPPPPPTPVTPPAITSPLPSAPSSGGGAPSAPPTTSGGSSSGSTSGGSSSGGSSGGSTSGGSGGGSPPPSVAPSITAQPANQVVNSGATATFQATASGTPTPTVQWVGSTDHGQTWSPVNGATSTTLSMITTAAEDGDEFEAMFTNAAGSSDSNAATLTVHSAPTITVQPADAKFGNGQNAQLTAGATGNPSPSVQWQVSSDGGHTWTNVSGATSTTYSFVAASSQNGDQYAAVFTNSVASTSTRGALITIISMGSSNWSGYVATGSGFSSVSGQWTVASVTCSTGENSDSSEWVGIDGVNSSSVEQDGTDSGCSNGTPFYDAWYEMYGDNAVNNGFAVALSPSNYPVASGDSISATVSVTGGNWTLTLADSTKGWTYSTSPISFSAPQTSAEWIIERPSTGSSFVNLSNFGTAGMTNATATDASTSGTIETLSGEAMGMFGTGGHQMAIPTAWVNGGGTFSDTWYAAN